MKFQYLLVILLCLKQILCGSIPHLFKMDSETSQSHFAEMHQRAKMARMQFLKDLAAVPKLPPGRLICYLGWSLGMSSIDATIVNICNPTIQHWHNFVPEGGQIPQQLLQWINDIYSITFSAFAIPASKIGDRYGVTVVHRWGVFGFMLFSALCGASSYINYQTSGIKYGGFYFLVAARFFQGIFAAFNMANTMSMCGILVESKDVAKSMANNSIAFSIATAIGPTLGGILVEYVNWCWCFYINLIIGTISMIVCWLKIPIVPKFKEDKFDGFGCALVLSGMLIFVFGMTYIPPDQGALSIGITGTIVGLCIMIFFIRWELIHPFAIMPKKLLKNKKIMYSFIAGFFNFGLIVTVSFQMPFVLQSILGYSPVTVGLINLVNPIAQIFGAMVVKKLIKEYTTYIIKLWTSVANVVFILLLGSLSQYGIWVIVPINFLYSFVVGMFFIANNSYMMATATPDIRGMIGGCVQAFRESGYATGIAFVNLIHEIFMNSVWGSDPMPPRDDPLFKKYAKDYLKSFFVTTCCMSVFVIAAMLFALASGVSDFEKGKKGYDKYMKKFAPKQLTTDIEQEPLLKNEEPTNSSTKPQ